MSHYQFTSRADAENYLSRCNAREGYPRPGVPEEPFPAGWTLKWAEIIEHPTADRWAVEVHEDVVAVGKFKLHSFPDDWGMNVKSTEEP